MGWKSTIPITRETATHLITNRITTLTDRELGDALESLGFGDSPDLAYFGHNFRIASESEVNEHNKEGE